jgi:hypothetical protein
MLIGNWMPTVEDCPSASMFRVKEIQERYQCWEEWMCGRDKGNLG